MSKEIKSLLGEVFGRWQVIGNYIINERKQRRWLCRCQCGTERYVLEKSLLYGGSFSCGCTRQESLSKSLWGQTFGELTVVDKADIHGKGGVWWKCRCSCGREYDVLATLLITGKKKHCGCKTNREYFYKDISGQKFESLTALYPTSERTKGGTVIWHCRCDCGNEVDVSYNELLYTTLKSCGCKKEEHNRKLQGFLTHIDGTSLDSLKSQKLWSNNTTGARGVYFIRGKYVAKFVFKKRAYYLGSYESFEEAAAVRKKAADLLRSQIVDYYDRWQYKAAREPEWAEQNPISISVRKCHDEIEIDILPILE